MFFGRHENRVHKHVPSIVMVMWGVGGETLMTDGDKDDSAVG